MAVSASQLITQHAGDEFKAPVAASTKLYAGAIAFFASGYASHATGSGSNAFAGIVRDEVDNSSGSAGDKSAELMRGRAFLLTGSGLTQALQGSKAYASDNYTVTGTSTSNSEIGVFQEIVSSTKAWVRVLD